MLFVVMVTQHNSARCASLTSVGEHSPSSPKADLKPFTLRMYSQTEHFIDSKMALTPLACVLLILSMQCYVSTLAVILKTTNSKPRANEFESVELSCMIESISTSHPRIEWKKIKNGEPSYVYFEKEIAGDLEKRAKIREPATLVILNATRSDTADYRCEVTAPNDQKSFDEILISLVVRVKPVVPRCSVPKSVPVGKSAELHCVEDEGFPKSQYQWFRNKEEIPEDPKTSPKFFNSSYTLNGEMGTLKFSAVRKEDAGEYYCRARNEAGFSECGPQMMEVYDINIARIILGVVVVVVVLLCITVGICCAYKRGYFTSQKQTGNNYKAPAKGDGVDYVRTEDEGDFRHKSSFVI
ncbi:junctional adhesion molecule 3B-like [Myxocyprinus asiaticus]|uniref:junctional adhesion molecule 3B-like n=1 Tax=Myxocyprinus asiaticus TaxID=70543 RepID=UPI002222D0BC|nr:junctional adhesion molecule 3B-like [Myxocyprinus asiaticus]